MLELQAAIKLLEKFSKLELLEHEITDIFSKDSIFLMKERTEIEHSFSHLRGAIWNAIGTLTESHPLFINKMALLQVEEDLKHD